MMGILSLFSEPDQLSNKSWLSSALHIPLLAFIIQTDLAYDCFLCTYVT